LPDGRRARQQVEAEVEVKAKRLRGADPSPDLLIARCAFICGIRVLPPGRRAAGLTLGGGMIALESATTTIEMTIDEWRLTNDGSDDCRVTIVD